MFAAKAMERACGLVTETMTALIGPMLRKRKNSARSMAPTQSRGFGAKSAAAQIHRVHAALKEFLGRPAEAGAAPPPETLEAALGPLEADLQRIGGRVKAAA